MKLFDAEHRAWQEENGRKLRERLSKQASMDVDPKDGMSPIRQAFCNNLLNSLNTRRVVK